RDGESAPSALARQLKLKAIYQGKTAVHHQVPMSRMTMEYLTRRNYLVGISDSYTRIRKAGGLIAESNCTKQPLKDFERFVEFCRRMPQKTPSQVSSAISRRVTNLGSRFS